MTANYYANVLKAWQKPWGSKPTADMFATVHAAGKRPGVEALHLAMCLRPEGCTVPQFTAAGAALKGGKCGPANNARRGLVAAGWFTQSIVPGSRPYAFMLTPTAKLKAALKAASVTANAAATAATGDTAKAKAKRASKPRKASKASAVQAPAPTPVDTAPQGAAVN